MNLENGKINMGIFYGKKYNSGNRTFSLENGENFIEGTGHVLVFLNLDWEGKESKKESYILPIWPQRRRMK